MAGCGSICRRHKFADSFPPATPGVTTRRFFPRCRTRGLSKERAHHLREALRLDPEHREARLALGYTSLDGKWVKTDEWNRRRGYVYHQGKWMTPQEVEALSAAQEVADLQQSWRPRLKLLRSIIIRNRDRKAVQEAVAEIRRIRDPLAGAALADMYKDEDAKNAEMQADLRRLWVETLGANTSGAAVDALAKAAIEDKFDTVREAARDALEESKDLRAVGALLAELNSKDNARVNRAGAALGRISDSETFLPLVEALVTEHKYIITQGNPGSTSATFSPQGGTSFNPGSKAKVIKRNVSNRSVLSALTAVVRENYDSNANFEYDKEAWKTWYSDQHTPDEITLRRDP